MWWIFPLSFFILSVIIAIGVVVRKIPQLRIINTDILPKEKTKRVKQAIIMRRFERHFGKRYKKGRRVFQTMGNHVSKRGRKFVQKLYAKTQRARLRLFIRNHLGRRTFFIALIKNCRINILL